MFRRSARRGQEFGRVRRSRRSGQSLVEFTLIAPILLLLVFGVVDFGLLFQDEIAVTNSARDGARWATTHPTAWSNAASPPSSTIEGQVLSAGGTANVPNDDSHIFINYFVPGSGSAVACGHWSASANAFVANTGYTQATCVVPGDLISVQVTYRYSLITPMIQTLFPSGVNVQQAATMVEEQ